MTDNINAISDESILTKIYHIRGQKVMIDNDLAELYSVPTKRLNEQVARNIERFPEDFMFKLTEEEFKNLKSQFATSSWGGTRKLPNVFTEHGVLMLSSILNSKQAIQVNIQIMRIFSRVRQILNENNILQLEIEKIKNHLHNQDMNIEIVFRYLDELSERIPQSVIESNRKRIGFKPDIDQN